MRFSVMTLAFASLAAGQGSLILNPDTTCCTRFGYDVSIDRGLVAVLETPITPSPLETFVYDLNTEQVVASYAVGHSDNARVLLEDDHLFIGVYNEFQVGEVHARHLVTGAWTTFSSTAGQADFFGVGLDYENGMLAIGAPSSTTLWIGQVFLHDMLVGGALVQTLDPVHPNTRIFGVSVALTSNRIFVGDQADVNGVIRRGVVEVFDRATYAHLGTIEPDPALDIAWFGRKIVANDDYLVVAAPYSNEFAFGGGAAFIYDANTSQLLHTLEPEGSEEFGWGVDIDGDTVAVGYFTGYGHVGGVRTYDAGTGKELQRFISPVWAPVGAGHAIAIGDGHVVAGLPSHGLAAGAIVSYDVAPHLGVPYCDAPVSNTSNFAARLRAMGSTSVSANDFHLRADQLPREQFCLFLNSSAQGFVAGFNGSSGDLCLGSPLGFHKSHVGRAWLDGTHNAPVDLQSLPRPGGTTHAVQPGETWNFQAWYRDGSTSNFTDAIAVTFD